MLRIKSQVVLLAFSAALSTASLSSSSIHKLQPLDLEFDRGVDSWRVVVDGVMGGRSSGRVLEGDSDVLVFNGKLSLENNGGFSQIRTNIKEGTLTDQDGVELRFLGDGRTYQFDIRVSNVRLMAGGFQTTFETTEGKWQTVQLPFNDFQLYTFGRKVPIPPALEPAKIESLGITLADKVPGDFRIEIDSIRSYETKESTRFSLEQTQTGYSTTAPSDLNKEAIRIYDLAVARGVPLFNDGHPKACAYVYEIAIESMIALGSDTLDTRGVERLIMGLAESEQESEWVDRAWVYRRALDEASERFRSNE